MPVGIFQPTKTSTSSGRSSVLDFFVVVSAHRKDQPDELFQFHHDTPAPKPTALSKFQALIIILCALPCALASRLAQHLSTKVPSPPSIPTTPTTPTIASIRPLATPPAPSQHHASRTFQPSDQEHIASRFAHPTRTGIWLVIDWDPPLTLIHLLLILFPTAPRCHRPPRRSSSSTHPQHNTTSSPHIRTVVRGFGVDRQATSSCFTFRDARRPRAQSASALSPTHFTAFSPLIHYALRLIRSSYYPFSFLPPLRTCIATPSCSAHNIFPCLQNISLWNSNARS